MSLVCIMIKPTCPWHIPNSVAWVNWMWKDLWSCWPGNISQLAPRLFIIVDENSVISNKLTLLMTAYTIVIRRTWIFLIVSFESFWISRGFVTDCFTWSGSSRWQGLSAKNSWCDCVHCTQLGVYIFVELARNVPVHKVKSNPPLHVFQLHYSE